MESIRRHTTFLLKLMTGIVSLLPISSAFALGVSNDFTSDPVIAYNESSDHTEGGAAADLFIINTGPGSAVAGSTVVYRLEIVNNGPTEAQSVNVSDTLPPGSRFISATEPCDGGFPCSLGTMTPDVIIEIEVSLEINENASGTVFYSASVDSATSDPDNSNNTASAGTLVVDPVADLSLLTTGPGSAAAGMTVVYRLAIANNGPNDAKSVSVSHTLPPGSSFVSATAPCAGGFPCSLGTMAQDAMIEIEVSFKINENANGSVSYSASVDSTTFDPANANNTSSTNTPLFPAADLGVSKTDGAEIITAGQAVVYTITVSNNGPADVTGASVMDFLPAELIDSTWTCAPGIGAACAAQGEGDINEMVDMSSGASVLFEVVATVASDFVGILTNSATVAAPLSIVDPEAANNASSDVSATEEILNDGFEGR